MTPIILDAMRILLSVLYDMVYDSVELIPLNCNADEHVRTSKVQQ